MGQRTKKYSLTLAGHRTSVSMEEPFWEALKDISKRKQQSITAIASHIDRNRSDLPLSSAIRIYVLEYYRFRNDEKSS